MKTVSVTIANSASLSSAIYVGDYKTFAFELPSGLDGTSLTFQSCSTADGTFLNVYDDAGNEVTATVAASRFVNANTLSVKLAGAPFIKIRTGTAGAATTQTGDYTFSLILKD